MHKKQLYAMTLHELLDKPVWQMTGEELLFLAQHGKTHYEGEVTIKSSAKDQIVSELSKGVVQGGTSYLSKKIAQPSIRVKAGYQLLLISKK